MAPLRRGDVSSMNICTLGTVVSLWQAPQWVCVELSGMGSGYKAWCSVSIGHRTQVSRTPTFLSATFFPHPPHTPDPTLRLWAIARSWEGKHLFQAVQQHCWWCLFKACVLVTHWALLFMWVMQVQVQNPSHKINIDSSFPMLCLLLQKRTTLSFKLKVVSLVMFKFVFIFCWVCRGCFGSLKTVLFFYLKNFVFLNDTVIGSV